MESHGVESRKLDRRILLTVPQPNKGGWGRRRVRARPSEQWRWMRFDRSGVWHAENATYLRKQRNKKHTTSTVHPGKMEMLGMGQAWGQSGCRVARVGWGRRNGERSMTWYRHTSYHVDVVFCSGKPELCGTGVYGVLRRHKASSIYQTGTREERAWHVSIVTQRCGR